MNAEPSYDCAGCVADFAVFGRIYCERCQHEHDLVAERRPLASRIEDALFDDVEREAEAFLEALDEWCSQNPGEWTDTQLRERAAACVKALRDQADALDARVAEVLP